jgi:hypothetical protein
MSNVVVDVGLWIANLKAEPQVCDYMTACELYGTGDARPLYGKLIPGTVTVEST